MRMKYTMSPYPNTHVYFYNGRVKIERVGKDEFVDFDETAHRSWERLLWAEGFRPVDEEGNLTMKQSTKSAPMRNLSDDDADIDHKQSVDPAVLAGNNAEFQELHADKLKEFEENAKLAAEGKVVDTTGPTPTVVEDEAASDTPPADSVDVNPLANAGAFGLTEEEAAAHTESNAVAPTPVDSNEAPENVDDDDDDDEKKPARRRRKKADDDKE